MNSGMTEIERYFMYWYLIENWKKLLKVLIKANNAFRFYLPFLEISVKKSNQLIAMFVVISQALRVDFPLFYLANINEFKFEKSLANSTENSCFHPRRQSFLCSLSIYKLLSKCKY